MTSNRRSTESTALVRRTDIAVLSSNGNCPRSRGLSLTRQYGVSFATRVVAKVTSRPGLFGCRQFAILGKSAISAATVAAAPVIAAAITAESI